MAGLGCHSTLSIGNHDFPVDLIVLESQGLDVILGMDWLTKFEGNIDCARKTILLTTPEQKRIKYVSIRTPINIGERIYSPKLVTLGSPSSFGREEGWNPENGCGLSFIERCDHQEQVPSADD